MTPSTTPSAPPPLTPLPAKEGGDLLALADMFRAGSSITEPSELLKLFGVWFNRDPVGELLVTVSRRGLEGDRYKVTRLMTRDDRIALHKGDPTPPSNPWRDWNTLKTHSGGVLASLTSGDRPAFFEGLDLAGDPVLDAEAGRLRSAVAIPTYDDGRTLNWAIFFFESPEPPPEEELTQLILHINLTGLATQNLVVRKEAERLNDQLQTQVQKIAAIQKSLLPERTPAIPGYLIATSYITSEDAGGDYYDFFPFPNGRWGILIADVSGHGPAAATVMAMLRAILHCYEKDTTTPDEVMRFANDKLTSTSLDGSFVTAFFAILDPATGEFQWTRCGHNPPRIRRASGEVVELADAGTLPLGIMPDLPAESASLKIEENDTIILYTDGITEAMNTDRELFTAARLDASLEDCSGAPDCVINHIYGALHDFTGTYRHDDDQTIVAIQRMDHSVACPVPQSISVKRDAATPVEPTAPTTTT